MGPTIKVLHIDSSKTWGGGQSQIGHLITDSSHLPIEHHLAAPKASKLYFKVRSQITGFLPIGRQGLFNPINLIQAWRYCKKNNIQVLHAHCGKSHDFAYWLKRLFMPSVVLVVHRRIPAKIRSNIWARKKFLDGTVNHYICVSNYIKGVLMRGGVSEPIVTTVRSSKKKFSCSNDDKSKARSALVRSRGLAPEGDFFILSASRLVHDKGLFILIEAFRKLVRQRPSSRLLIAGEGELETALKTTAQSLMESGHLVFLGFRKDVVELLLGSDIFAIPSLSEGLGSTIIEAMFARTAVIGSAVEGIPELITQEKTGLLVPPGDAQALFEAFSRLAENPRMRAQLAEQAYIWAQEACGSETMVERTFAVYRSLVNR